MTHGRLVVPEGLVIDELARERLTRQVQRQPPEVAAVGAEVEELPPGSSYRVHAEWRSLEPLSACVAAPASSVRGAVLVRPGVDFEVRDGIVSVDGALVIDRGAHTHDPWLKVGPLQNATDDGRPPFPHRPVVLFAAAGAISDDRSDWARRMVNRLVRREVEGRLALTAAGEGLQLTRPCLPGAASVRALAPDVIVTLDAGAAEQVAGWCGSDRSTVVVELIDDVTVTQRLVSWQIARARGRVRAQVSRRIGAPALANLVRRLCAGPHPMPPLDRGAERATVRVREHWGGGAARESCVVLTGAAGTTAGRTTRVEGLIDQFEAAGIAVERAPIDRGVPAGAASAAVVVLVGVDETPATRELVASRSAQRRATVLDVDPSEISARGDGSNDSVALAPHVAALAATCRYVVTPTEAVRTALGGLSVRSLVVPTMLTRERASALRNAGVGGRRRAAAIVGWHVGRSGDPGPDYLEAVAGGIAKVLADRVELRVEVVGDEDRVPAALRRHDRVSVVAGRAEPELIADWTLHVWSPCIIAGEIVDDLAAVVEASYAGVPTVLPASARSALDGAASGDLVVSSYDEPEAWSTALRVLLDDDHARAEHASEARRWAQTVHGAAACRATVTRLLGWATYKVKR